MTSHADRKQRAQDLLMSAMQVALSQTSDADTDDARVLRNEALRQFRRVEKLFGYDPFTWAEGV